MHPDLNKYRTSSQAKPGNVGLPHPLRHTGMSIPRNLPIVWRAALLFVSLSSAARGDAGADWPQFRGPAASGVSPVPGPVEWDVNANKAIRWKTPVPGLGHSCPIVWGDRVFLTTAVPVSRGDEQLRTGLYGDIAPVEEDAE